MARAATQTAGTRARKSSAKAEKATETDGRIDLTGLNHDELLQLQKDVDRALRTYEKRKRDEALREMQSVAEKHGLALKDVIGTTQPGRRPQVPKYQHPENPARTWSGRGRQPDWFKQALDAGANRDDLLIA